MLARHEPREHQFDSDPGVDRSKLMNGFWATSDYRKRRDMIRSARHRGSMPSDVLRDLNQTMTHHSLTWKVGTFSNGKVTEQGTLQLACGPDSEPLSVDALVLATGFEPTRPGANWSTNSSKTTTYLCPPVGIPLSTSSFVGTLAYTSRVDWLSWIGSHRAQLNGRSPSR